MKRKAIVLALALSVAGATGALAHSEQKAGVLVTHPWVAPAQAGAMTTGHPTIVNRGDATIEIVKITSRAAGRLQLILDGEPVDTVSLGAGKTLSPKRLSIRFEDLAVDLPEGKAVPVKFHFAGREAMEIHMAIGRDTMNPEQVVELPPGHHGGDGEEKRSGEHRDR